MYTKIVVGIDGARGGTDALALARDLGGSDAELILVTAYPYETHPTRASVGGYEELLREDADKTLAAAAGDADLRTVACPDPSPARALHRIAEEEAADLIVVGSCHHEHLVGRVLLGNVARATLHSAPCAVAVAPRGYASGDRSIAQVGVGYQHTDEGQLALMTARDIARQHGAAVRALTVVSPPAAFTAGASYTYDWTALQESLEKVAREELEQATADLGVPVTTDVVVGLTNTEMEGLSSAVDVLVLGSRGWGTAKRVLIGSTADRLANTAHCPLVVVPRGTGARADAEDRAALQA